MSDLTFRPRSATEIIDGTFRLYRENFVPLVTLSTLVYLPVIALTIPMMMMMNGMVGASAEKSTVFGILFMAVVFFSFLWYPVLWGALTLSVSERYLGRDIDAGDAIRRTFSRYGPLLGSFLATWALIFFVSFFSWILLFFPTFYLLARFFAIPATTLLENRGVGASFRRSSQLSIKQKMHIFGTLLLAWAIVLGVFVAIYMLLVTILGISLTGENPEAMAGTSSMLLQIPSIITYILLLPIVVVAEVLLYYDTRIRQEGYDIELMSAQLAGPEARVAAN